MKQIIAIIQPHRLDAVEHALQSLSHLPGFTSVSYTHLTLPTKA